MINKRFIFATIAIICGSVVSILLKYPSTEYVKIVGIISGIFIGGQTFTDHKKLTKEVGGGKTQK